MQLKKFYIKFLPHTYFYRFNLNLIVKRFLSTFPLQQVSFSASAFLSSFLELVRHAVPPNPVSLLVKKGSRFLPSGKGGILMTRLVGISPKRIHSGMHRGTQWVSEPCLSSTGQWAGCSWMEQAGSVREPNPHAGQPKALGLGPPVNYAVSCLICYVPGWQEATGACGHTVTQRVRQGGGAHCIWHVSVTLRRAPGLSQ